MVEFSDEPNLSDRIRYTAPKAYVSYIPSSAGDQRPALLVTNQTIRSDAAAQSGPTLTDHPASVDTGIPTTRVTANDVADQPATVLPPAAPPPNEVGDGEIPPTLGQEKKPVIVIRLYRTLKDILLSRWLNSLLIFVPIGIAVQAAGVNPTIVFAMNAIAIIPLAGLLSYATESVASELGDTIGALMNVTFGNAVELIILNLDKKEPEAADEAPTCNSFAFHVYLPLVTSSLSYWHFSASHAYTFHVIDYSIALVKNEIRIVQASLLGSILANLLLILGMCFLFGGLRFREQIYNSTVTQMSACLLSLSVMSLLLPTAFHASFTNNATADKAVLQVSRGTSIILLLVYVLYLLFQLKSHAYMYQSTPQHVIDEESHPGVLAEMLGSSTPTSSSDSSGSSDSDSDGSSGSHTTAKRIKRVLRGRRRRKSSASSKDAPSVLSTARTPSVGTSSNTFDRGDVIMTEARIDRAVLNAPFLGAIASGDEADTDGEHEDRSVTAHNPTVNFRDFENEKAASGSKSPRVKPRKRRSKRMHRKTSSNVDEQVELSEKSAVVMGPAANNADVQSNLPHVKFVKPAEVAPEYSPKRPFNLRGLSVRGTMPTMLVLPMPTIPRMLSSTVFSATNPTGLPTNGPSAMSRSLRRTKSLTDLDERGASLPPQPLSQHISIDPSHPSSGAANINKLEKHMSRTTAILLLFISTGLVAVCAEFLVDSINYLVDNTSLSEAFVGLIILPIVGNAAEHVTAVTVASKNKMDLAIGVAVGSSIQIALFVTPVIVLLGWILAKDMSLYFSLFETVSLFVSAFIVNFLVLDGRSNYLEGALLIAAYVIIALAAFFYPDSSQQSTIGGANN